LLSGLSRLMLPADTLTRKAGGYTWEEKIQAGWVAFTVILRMLLGSVATHLRSSQAWFTISLVRPTQWQRSDGLRRLLPANRPSRPQPPQDNLPNILEKLYLPICPKSERSIQSNHPNSTVPTLAPSNQRGTGLKRRAKRFVSVSGKCFPICYKTEHILLLKRLGTLWLGLARALYSKKFS